MYFKHDLLLLEKKKTELQKKLDKKHIMLNIINAKKNG